jgi:hypothetical protein
MDIRLDRLTICYKLEDNSIIWKLRDNPDLEIDWKDTGFYLRKIEGTHFDFIYQIVYNDYADNNYNGMKYQIMGTVCFGLRSDKDKAMSNLAWLHIENKQFYLDYNYQVKGRTIYIDYIANVLGLHFNNVTNIDLAVDGSINFSKRIIHLIRDKQYIPILNGRKRLDRKEIIEEILYEGIGSLDRIKEFNVYIKQKKALRDKSSGLTLAAYNKNREISNNQNKEYIRELYLYPKRLYRLEVRINSESIKAFLNENRIVFSSLLLWDDDFLWFVFRSFLNRLLRFQSVRGRHTFEVLDLIE